VTCPFVWLCVGKYKRGEAPPIMLFCLAYKILTLSPIFILLL
jgi:hypothetical protein